MRFLTPLILSIALVGTADAQQWTEGRHYQRLPDAPERAADAPIEVIEVFWYGCAACFQFEPLIDEWERTRPADVEFNRIGITFSGTAQMHARAYYTAEALGVAECVHRPIFSAIHGRNQGLADVDSLARFFQREANIAPDEFRRAWDGFGVDRRVRAGDQLVRQLRIGATPTVVVNRKYTLTPGSAGGFPQSIALLNHLVELERGAPNEFTDARAPVPCPDATAAAAAAGTDSPATGADDNGPSFMAFLPLIIVAGLVLVGFGVWRATSKKRG